MECDESKWPTKLEDIYVSRGYWRATDLSTEVYECRLDNACLGGPNVDEQCARGHHGALCAACERNYYLDLARNRCVECSSRVSPGKILAACAIALSCVVLLVGVLSVRFGLKRVTNAMKEAMAGECTGKGENDTVVVHAFDDDDPERRRSNSEEQDAQAAEERNQKFWKSVLVKLKIVVAAYQIASSVTWVLPTLKFPTITTSWLRALNFLNLDLSSLATTDCWMHTTFYGKFLFATIAPVVIVTLGALVVGIYILFWRPKKRSDAPTREEEEHRVDAIEERAYYALLLLLYVCLPGCSSYTFRYFGCRKLDRGVGRNELNVLLVDPDLRCAGKRYKSSLQLVLMMIVVWPIGVPACFAILLWRNRHKINPKMPDAASADAAYASLLGFDADRDRFFQSVQQRWKIEAREQDESIKWLEFLYEEYEPRCMYFPLVELARRIFLTGILGMLHPGSPSQIYVGFVAASVLYRIYIAQKPYIVDSDDIVSEAAQTQAVIMYFGALVVYASNELNHKQGVFDSTIFGVLLIFIYSLAFFFASWHILVDVFGYNPYEALCACCRRKKQDDGPESPRSRESNPTPLATNAMPVATSNHSQPVDLARVVLPSPRALASLDGESSPENGPIPKDDESLFEQPCRDVVYQEQQAPQESVLPTEVSSLSDIALIYPDCASS
ncbi:hypothetical protein CTAYLR_005533 [Chrysophaeum taylorii]|uniref:Uncharacterized protein n=1 Tax=Chrysophaeum taylorii TaxID=2483200 RepID=A0AAD7U503_9STRA|nr:hypothetical protein CTAYLR_005533 [Chrysophaeum taylorii]